MMTNPFPEAYLGDGLLVFGSLAKGGQVAMGLWVDVPPLHNASNQQRNAFQDRLRQVLRILPKGYRLQVQWWVDSDYRVPLKRYADLTENCDHQPTKRLRNLTVLRELERMKRQELRHARCAIFIGRTIGTSDGSATASVDARYSEALQSLKVELGQVQQQIAQILGNQGGRVTPMRDEEVHRLWMRKFNPSMAHRMETLENPPGERGYALLDDCWNSELKGHGARGFVLDGQYHAVLLLKRCPSHTYPTLIHRLTELSFGDYDISVQVECVDPDSLISREQKELDRLRRQYDRRRDERLGVAIAKKEDRIRRLSESSIVPLTMEFMVVIRGNTVEQLSTRVLAIKSAIHGMHGAQYLECTLPASARNAFSKSLPGWMWGRQGGIALEAEDTYAADLLPVCNSFTGHLATADAIYPGVNNNLVGVKFFSGEGLHCTPQNSLVIGGAGMGKSEGTSNLLMQTANEVGLTVIIEEGLSHARFTRSHGIAPIVLRQDGGQTVNVFDTQRQLMSEFQRSTITGLTARMVGLPSDEDRARHRTAVIAKYLARLCRDHAEDYLRSLSASKRAELVREFLVFKAWAREHNLEVVEAFGEFRTWREKHSEDHGTRKAALATELIRACENEGEELLYSFVFSVFSPAEHLTLSSFREFLELAGEGADAEECQRIATLLAPWCRGGNYGSLWDGPGNVSLQGRVIHFELGFISESASELKGLAGFALMNQVRQHILNLPREVKKQVVIEEVARFLDVPGGERILRELYQSFRKHNCVVISIMQQYSQIADTPIRAALVGNARIFIIFNPGDVQDLERLAHDIRLSQAAVDAILKYPLPAQLVGAKYSEFCYFHTDPQQQICGTVRNIRIPDSGYDS